MGGRFTFDRKPSEAMQHAEMVAPFVAAFSGHPVLIVSHISGARQYMCGECCRRCYSPDGWTDEYHAFYLLQDASHRDDFDDPMSARSCEAMSRVPHKLFPEG